MRSIYTQTRVGPQPVTAISQTRLNSYFDAEKRQRTIHRRRSSGWGEGGAGEDVVGGDVLGGGREGEGRGSWGRGGEVGGCSDAASSRCERGGWAGGGSGCMRERGGGK